MKIVSKRLSALKMRHLKAAERRQTLCDGEGLYLVISPVASGGSFAWEYRYTSPETGRRTCLRLGFFPVVSLEEARKARFEAARMVHRGVSPTAERRRCKAQAKADSLTVERAFAQWRSERGGAVRASTMRRKDGEFSRWVRPKLGNRRLAEVTRGDLQRLLDDVKARGGVQTASLVCQLLHQLFEFFELRGSVSANPATLLKRVYRPRAYQSLAALVDETSFGELLGRIDDLGDHSAATYALKLLPLVFVRPNELLRARWEEINFDAATWVIPAARMKVASNGDHVVPLSRQALELLRRQRVLAGGSEWVFPSPHNRNKKIGPEGLRGRLAALGCKGRHTLHGFRSSASTLLNKMAVTEHGKRFNAEHIELQLAHGSASKIRSTYMRADFEAERRVMMQVWADECDRLKAASAPAGARPHHLQGAPKADSLHTIDPTSGLLAQVLGLVDLGTGALETPSTLRSAGMGPR